MTSAGHRTLPHTADVRIEAWASTRELCVAEAVVAMVETFADHSDTEPIGSVAVEITEPLDDRMLVAVLDEVIYLMDTANRLPVSAVVDDLGDAVEVEFTVVDTDDIELVGAVPKAISLHELEFEEAADGIWLCRVTIDI